MEDYINLHLITRSRKKMEKFCKYFDYVSLRQLNLTGGSMDGVKFINSSVEMKENGFVDTCKAGFESRL